MIVGGFGVPHTPHYPSIVANGGPAAEEIVALYGEVRARLEAARPDVIVFLTSDHYNLFWETCIPIFSVAVAPSAWGASDYDTIPRRELPMYDELLLGWRDRSPTVPAKLAKQVHPGGGIIRAVTLVDGVVIRS